MDTIIYDVEVFRNFFCATFLNAEDDNYKSFSIEDGRSDILAIKEFLKTPMVLVGYNNINYDNPVLRFIQGYNGSTLLKDLFSLSAKLVNDSYRNDKNIMKLRYPRDIKYAWKSIDLMALFGFDKLGISLKQVAINLKHERIQDLPLPFDAHVHTTQTETVLDYNHNDCVITKKLYKVAKPVLDLRVEIGSLYGVDVMSASKSKMANVLLEKFYKDELGIDNSQLKDLRTNRDKFLLKDCFASFVEFKSPQLQEVVARISSTYVHSYNKFKYSETVYYAGCTFSLGVGGLHTVDEPGIFQTDDNYIIQDCDGSSYYPNIIINNNFYPEHLGKEFISILKKITAERIEAKHSGNKVKAEALKITINSLFGKMGSPFFWLYDPKQLLSTTISGQMGLLMLVEAFHAEGIHVISCNTDGVVCKIPRELESRYYEITKEWERKTGIELEFTPYKKYIRRDVNSYITEKMDGKTKEKGAFLRDVALEKAYHMPIVGKALYAYFFEGIPVRKTIETCSDIMEFCISQKSAGNFGIELQSGSGVESLQKTNRFYITKKGGAMTKKDNTTKKVIGLHVGRLVRVLNDYDPSIPFSDYVVDFAFYEKEVMKIVDKIEPKQMNLLDLSGMAQSYMTKMEAPLTKLPPAEEIINIRELNKLGKNQLVKKLDVIAKNGQTIDNISPRYVYVIDMDSRKMIAKVYCLGKGITQSLTVNKIAYKKQAFITGNLVYCDKFSRNAVTKGHNLDEFHVTEKIEEGELTLGLDK